MSHRLREGAILGLSATALAGLHWIPLADRPGFTLCAFYWLTGKLCPFCGMTRALAHLAKGEWQSGLQMHPLSPIVFGLILVAFGVSALRLLRLEPPQAAIPWKLVTALFAVVGFIRMM